MLTQKKKKIILIYFTAGNVGNFMDMPKPKDLVNPNTGELYTNTEWNDLKREIGSRQRFKWRRWIHKTHVKDLTHQHIVS